MSRVLRGLWVILMGSYFLAAAFFGLFLVLLTDPAALRKLAEAATPIVGFPGYSVDRLGRVFAATNWRGHAVRVLVSIPNDHGYPKVRLVAPDGRRRNRPIHRLVADAFLPPRPSSHHEIRHLNGDKNDSCVENLAWGTRGENAHDREAHGHTARGSRNGFAKLTEEQVVRIRAIYAAKQASQYQLAAVFGVSQRAIGRVVRREVWTHVSG